MSARNDGGPAFARPISTNGFDYPDRHVADEQSGMTLRDYFAGQAIGAVIRQCAADTIPEGQTRAGHFAEHAYQVADAMLAAREADQ